MTRYIFLISAMAFSLFAGAQNVGIGTTTPAAKLDVIGSVKITDGTEGANKILTSNANGLATWATPPLPPCFLFNTDQAINSGNYIGFGTSSSSFIRNTIVVPFNCTLSSIILSTRGSYQPNPITATVWVQSSFTSGLAVATSLSTTVSISNSVSVATGSIALNMGDLVSVQLTGGSSLVNGVAVSVTYK